MSTITTTKQDRSSSSDAAPAPAPAPAPASIPTPPTTITNTAAVSLNSLPDDQRQHVLSYLTCSELHSLLQVSKAIQSIVLQTHTLVAFHINDDEHQPQSQKEDHQGPEENVSLRRSIRNGSMISPGALRRWSATSTYFQTVSPPRLSTSSSTTSGDDEEEEQEKHRTSRLSPNYTTIITESNLFHLLQSFQSLRTLKLYNLAPLQEQFLPILNECPSAKSLIHLECHNVKLIHDHHHDTPNTTTYYNLSNLTNVQTLILTGTIFCSYTNVLQSICTSSNNLHTLILNGCRSLTDEDVYHLSQHLFWTTSSSSKKKKKKKKKHCELYELSLENSSNLIKPYIQNQPSTSNSCSTTTTTQFPNSSSSFQKLNLSQCPMLQDVSQIQCPTLIDINLSNCPMIHDASIHALLRNCPRIERLHLCGCSSLQTLDIPTTSSTMLRCLDLNLCLGLISVNIHGDRLTSLEVCRTIYMYNI